MTFTVPSGLIQTYNAMGDASLSFWAKNITLVYPPKQVKCINCITNTLNGISTNRYLTGGPQPFTFGNCPYCEGAGYVPTEVTETVQMIVYNNVKAFANFGVQLDIPAGSIQTKASVQLYPKLTQCTEIRYSNDVAGFGLQRYNRLTDINFYGLGNRWCLAIWKPFRGAA